MSIRVSGNATITSDDLRWSYRGRSFGVELSDDGMGHWISVVETFTDGRPPAYLGEPMLHCDEDDIKKAGGAMEWIKTEFLQWLKRVLAALFPASADPMAGKTEFEKVDALLAGAVRIVQKADGSLDAALN